jgi:arabinofuranosyltransferase
VRLRSPDRSSAVLVAIGVVTCIVLVRNAWVSDDAFITFRTIENWLHGHGLTWNPDERVQVYTDPLWMLLLTVGSLVSGELVTTSMVLGIAITLAALLLFAFGTAASRPTAAAGLVILLFSKAFVDYATSGLENPLAHLLLASVVLVHRRWLEGDADGEGADRTASLTLFGALVALLALTRLDAILIVLPLLAHTAWRRRSVRAWGALALGFVPLVLWEGFSLLYYGFPFPNTAYAKLGTGIGTLPLVRQGLWYLWNSLRNDPLTLPVTALGIAVPLLRRDPRVALLSLGIGLQLLYVVWVGGDFMSGRFLTLPLFGAVLALGRRPLGWRPAGAVAAVAILAGMLASQPPLLSGSGFGMAREDFSRRDAPGRAAHLDAHGVADERWFYYQSTGLLHHGLFLTDHVWVRTGLEARRRAPLVRVFSNIGMLGYFAGPRVHIIDRHALADPLLARLPTIEGWRIGHFPRDIPEGYVDSVRSGTNRLRDPELARLYDALLLVARGPLFRWERLRAIWELNTCGLRRTPASGPPATRGAGS